MQNFIVKKTYADSEEENNVQLWESNSRPSDRETRVLTTRLADMMISYREIKVLIPLAALFAL